MINPETYPCSVLSNVIGPTSRMYEKCVCETQMPQVAKCKIWKNLEVSHFYSSPTPRACDRSKVWATLRWTYSPSFVTVWQHCYAWKNCVEQNAEWKSTVKVTLVLTTIGQSHLRNVYRPAITCWITILPFFHKKQHCCGPFPCFSQDFPNLYIDCFYLISQKSSTWGNYSREDIQCRAIS